MIKGEDIWSEYKLDNSDFNRKMMFSLGVLMGAQKQMEGSTKRTYRQMTRDLNRFVRANVSGAGKMAGSWWKRFGVVALGFTLAYRAMNLLEHGIMKVVETMGEAIRESGELAALQAKLAMWTTIHSQGVITYAEAFERAAVNVRALQKASLTSVSSLAELAIGMDELGQAVGAVPAYLAPAVTSLVDFTVLIAQTTGSTTRQIRQEFQAFMEGQVRTTNILVRTLKRVGIITEQDLKDLRNMVNQGEILTKVLEKVHTYWQDVIETLLRTDVTIAMGFWNKSIRYTMTEAIRLGSALEGVGDIFAETFAAHAKKFLKDITADDWKRMIIMVLKLRDGLDFLLTMFERVFLGMGKLVVVGKNVVVWMNSFSDSTVTAVMALAGLAVITPILGALQKFGKMLIYLAFIPIKGLTAALTFLLRKLILIPLALTVMAVAWETFYEMSEQSGSVVHKFTDKIKEAVRIAGRDSPVEEFTRKWKGDWGKLETIILKTNFGEFWGRFYDQMAKSSDSAAEDISKKFGDMFKENLRGWLVNIKDFFKPIWDTFSDVFKDLFKMEDLDLDKLIAAYEKDLPGLGMILKKMLGDDSVSAKALKSFRNQINKTWSEVEILRQTMHALKEDVIDPEDAEKFKAVMDVIIKSIEVPSALRDEWIDAKFAVLDYTEAYKTMLAEIKVEKTIAELGRMKEVWNALKVGVLQLKDVEKYKTVLELIDESEDVVESLRDEWLDAKLAVDDYVAAIKKLVDQSTLQIEVTKKLKEFELNTFEYRQWLLDEEYKLAKKVAEGKIKLLKDLKEAHRLGTAEILADYKAEFDVMKNLSQRTAEAIEQNFSDFWFDVFKGELDNLGDVVNAFFNSIQRAASDVLGQLTRVALFGIDTGKGFEGGLVGGIADWIKSFQHGGWLTEPVFGVGKSGRFYSFAEHAPEHFGSGGGNVSVQVLNYSGQRAQVKEGRSAQGGRSIQVIIGETAAGDIRNQGPLFQEVRRTFGLSPAVGGR